MTQSKNTESTHLLYISIHRKKALCMTVCKLLALYIERGSDISRAYMNRKDFIKIFLCQVQTHTQLSAIANKDYFCFNFVMTDTNGNWYW